MSSVDERPALQRGEVDIKLRINNLFRPRPYDVLSAIFPVVQALRFIFRISFLKLGQDYPMKELTATQKAVVQVDSG